MNSETSQSSASPDPELARIMEDNIRALLARRSREQKARRLSQRIADPIAAFAGSMWFVYLHLVLFGAWIIGNLPGVPFPKFDSSYLKLSVFASVEAIFLSTFVLIQQNRAAVQADKRDDMHLQISLLAEHEVTQLIKLVSEIAARMGIADARSPELDELKRNTGPEKVLDTMDKAEKGEGLQGGD